MILKTPKANAVAVTEKLLKQLKVAATSTTLRRALEDHPDFPSLLTISDCLTEYGLENETYRISREEYKVEELMFPFIAHLADKGGQYILVSKIEKGQVVFLNEHTNNGQMLEAEFLKRWTGVALYAIANENSGEVDYHKNNFKSFLQSLKAPVAIIALGIILTLALISVSASIPTLLSFAGLLLLKVLGIGISVLLLIQSLNANNPFIKNLCSLAGKNDCNAILKSDAAKVTSWLNWSEVGFFYFAGSFLALILSPSSLTLLAWLNLFALPYTIYSISYQYKNKNWCVLCCAVQGILILEALTFLSFSSLQFLVFDLVLSINNVLLVIICFITPLITWAFLKPFFISAAQLKPIKEQLKKFKYNSDLFNQALQSQPKYAISEELMPIILGNPNADTIITMVSNPFCGPCAKAHQTIDEWMKHRDDIQLKVIFTSSNDDNEPKTKISRHLNALSNNKDKGLVATALNDWYSSSNKNYEVWSANYPVKIGEELRLVTEKQKAWCDLAEIKFTPTILVNGYKLPEPYRLEDIKYLLSV